MKTPVRSRNIGVYKTLSFGFICDQLYIYIYIYAYFVLVAYVDLPPWAGNMNQIARCDWLPERARWSYLARSGQPTVSRKKKLPVSHIINPGWFFFLRVYGPRLHLGP